MSVYLVYVKCFIDFLLVDWNILYRIGLKEGRKCVDPCKVIVKCSS